MDPMTMMLIGTGLNIGTKLLFPQKSGMVNPNKYRKNMESMYDGQQQSINRTIGQQVNSSISGIQQAGAAGRLPEGAVMSGIQGAQYRGNEAAGNAGLQIADRKNRSMMDFYQMQNQYSMGNAQAQNANVEGFRGDIGNMTRLGMLWKAGYFNNIDQENTINSAGATGNIGAGATGGMSF